LPASFHSALNRSDSGNGPTVNGLHLGLFSLRRSHANLIWSLDRSIYVMYLLLLDGGMAKAKLFMTGGSQAVRLPAAFRFEGDEVDIRRNPVTGDVVLSRPIASWNEYFDWVRKLKLPSDFLRGRDQPEDDMRDPSLRRKSG
jgi:antitoxin VapB